MAENGSFKPLKDTVSSALIDVTRTAGKIAAEDLAFQRSSNPAIAPLLDKQSQRLLDLVRGLTEASTAGTDVRAPVISDVDALEENWPGLVDVFDSLLEKADACLDEYTGVIKKRDVLQEQFHSSTAKKNHPHKNYRSQVLPKPQLLFEHTPNNDDTTLFKPFLHSKPHAIQPLDESLRPDVNRDGREQYNHPYKAEIEASKYPDFVRHDDVPIPFLPFESTAAIFVDTPEAVALMLQELKSAKEIAVDLEHHDAHSYIGLTSLMQISTRSKDWVVDTLKPWREDLQVLNEVFADPGILKVFHGAFMDMIWLQRDLGLYVVGLFDTYHASKTLGYPKNSLAALLARHANFNAAKQYQMADWRMRPLPEEMFNYARSDTHFLLYIYDILRNELLANSRPFEPDGDLIDVVLRKSKEEALQRYEKPLYDAQGGTGASGWYNLLSYTPALLSREQFAVFRAVHQWRDNLARREDESLNTIMPKHVIYSISREMPLDMAALLGCSQPISTFVRSRIGDLLAVVKRAKTEGATGPELMDLLRKVELNDSEMRDAKVPAVETALASTTAKSQAVVPLVENPISSRLGRSMFWGPTVDRVAQGNSSGLDMLNPDNIFLALPLPQLTAEVFIDSGSAMNSVKPEMGVDPGARVEHAYVRDKKRKEEEVFVVKHVSGTTKRKAAELEDLPGSSEPIELISNGQTKAVAPNGLMDVDEPQEILLGDDYDQEDQDKAAHKALRKARKKEEKKRRKLGEQLAVSKANEEVAFDYASAPSVLHAKQSKPVGIEGLPFNPYSKSADAPKGMRHFKKETPGKSMTFNS